jgi:UPF0755 protein
MENQPSKSKLLKYLAIIGGIAVILVVAGVFFYLNMFGAPQAKAGLEQLTVPLGSGDFINLSKLLKEKGFIKSESGFKIAYFKTIGIEIYATTCVDCFVPGAYKLSKSMNAWEVANVIKQQPYMKWVVIPEGLRKEQIVEILADPLALGWSNEQKSDWVTKYTAMKYDYIEGVYFPDTYLIPVDEKPLDVANRLRAKFEEKFAPYSQEALKQNIKWDTLLKVASIVQREAAGKDDAKLIAGIIWNRLLNNKKLEIDATIQYIDDSRNNYQGIQCGEITPCANQELVYVGNYGKQNGWWQPIKAADIQKVSAYNTYLNQGLPPHPICNPGIDAINAALNPTETKCLYYLHDNSKIIHCAETYEEHQANIDKYLK